MQLTQFLLLFFKFHSFRFLCCHLFCVLCSSKNCNKLNSILYGICLSFRNRDLKLFRKTIVQLFLLRYFSRIMAKRSTLQFYRTIFLAQLWMAVSNHLFNKCDEKVIQAKNQIMKHQVRRKIKASGLVKVLSCFFKWLDCVILRELQVSNALQHRFKIFSDAN